MKQKKDKQFNQVNNQVNYGRCYTIVVPGVPPSSNHCYLLKADFKHGKKRVFRFMTKAGKDFKKKVYNIVQEHPSVAEFPLLNKKYKVRVTLFFGDKIRRDLDNSAGKVILDSLNNVVIEDDFHIDELSIKRRYDPINPRTVVDIIILEYKQGESDEPKHGL